MMDEPAVETRRRDYARPGKRDTHIVELQSQSRRHPTLTVTHPHNRSRP